MVRFSFCFETKHGGYVLVFVHLLNVLSSDGIPIRAGDDIDGDDSEELQYEWSTEGEREIEPGRDSPLVDQVCVCVCVCVCGVFSSLFGWIIQQQSQELLPVHLDHGQRVEEVAEEFQESDLEEEPVTF